ncbi:MAG: protein kinase [Gemmatimonadaceae bacterium]|nr:protein kinase [Gemmatimonadaceae bacterium]
MSASEAHWIGGKYEILRELGSGGFATVYLAKEAAGEVAAERLVAVKVLRDDSTTSDARVRFSQEVRVMANLRHPHIVPMFDTGVWNGRPYLVMPYVEGETLARRMRAGRLDVRVAARMASEMCDALDYAHSRHIVHRDVKPSNIMFDLAGNAWLADFGVARWTELTGDDRPTRSSMGPPGTAAYASPEQLAGGRHLDGRSDLYSLGVALFEALTGELPYGKATGPGSLLKRLEGNLPTVRSRRGDVASALSEAVEKCLHLDPAHRWATAADARDAFRAVSNTLGARSPRPWVTAPRIAAVASIGALVGIVLMARAARPRSEPSVAAAPTTRVAVTRFERRGASVAPNIEARIRDALYAWQGLDVVGGTVAGQLAIPDGGIQELGRRLRADLVVTGEVDSLHDGARVIARLWQVRPPRLVRYIEQPLIATSSAIDDSLPSRMVAQLLLAESARGAGITSYPTGLAYAAGIAALETLDVTTADSMFALALTHDPGLAGAALRLAQVRSWSDRPLPEWSFLLTRAQQFPKRLSRRDIAYLRPLLLQARSDVVRACPIWRHLADSLSGAYEAWLGYAWCLRSDRLVIGETSRPRFRASHHAALDAYRRALELVPANPALGNRSFELVRRFMLTSMNAIVEGRDASGRRYAGVPAMARDSLYLVAIPSETLRRGRSDILPRTHGQAVSWQRRMFDSLTASWVAAYPSSSDALLARSIAFEMQRDERMFESIRAARKAALSPSQQLVTGAAQVRMLIKRGVSDGTRLPYARALSDSLLERFAPIQSVDRAILASLALLRGRVSEADQWIRARTPRPLDRDTDLLIMYSALQEPADTITTLIRRLVEEHGRVDGGATGNWLVEGPGFAATLSFPTVVPEIVRNLSATGDYLLDAQLMVLRGDAAGALVALRDVLGYQTNVPTERSLDAVCAEARTIAAAGDAPGGWRWLSLALSALDDAPPGIFADAVTAGGFRVCLENAAALGARVGAGEQAAKYRAAAEELGRGPAALDR